METTVTDEEIGRLIPTPHDWIKAADEHHDAIHPLWVRDQFVTFAHAVAAIVTEDAAKTCEEYAAQNLKIDRLVQAEAQRFVAYAIRTSLTPNRETTE